MRTQSNREQDNLMTTQDNREQENTKILMDIESSSYNTKINNTRQRN